MRYVILILFISNLCIADESFTASKQSVFAVACERTYFRMLFEYGPGSRPLKDLSASVVGSCSRMADSIEKRKEWSKVRSPAGQGCREAIRMLKNPRPELPSEDDLFLKLCYTITEVSQ